MVSAFVEIVRMVAKCFQVECSVGKISEITTNQTVSPFFSGLQWIIKIEEQMERIKPY
jgi:hypothetical protein